MDLQHNSFTAKQFVCVCVRACVRACSSVLPKEINVRNIHLIKLWKALEETRISYTLIKIVKGLYRKSLSYVKLAGLLSEAIKTYVTECYRGIFTFM